MFQTPKWEFTPPTPSLLSDHAVPQLSTHLKGKKIALMVCGGIAAIKTPLLARSLRRHGAQVTVFASSEALRYVTEDALAWSSDAPIITRLSARAEHLSDHSRFDAYLVAPATYNTINKVAWGVADTLITATLSSAIGRLERGETQILIAPTMHGTMHNSILIEALHRLRERGVELIRPRDAYGKDNIPSEEVIVLEVMRKISSSPLKGHGILVTGGPTPVAIDGVRRITNKFTGRLAIKIAQELVQVGADVRLLLGRGSITPPLSLTPYTEQVSLFEQYRQRVLELSGSSTCSAGIFSAAVADYQPAQIASGKIPSGQSTLSLTLAPTPKVIQEVRQANPLLKMVTFKYQEEITHDELMKIAEDRVKKFGAVFANRGEERGAHGEQVGWWCVEQKRPQRVESKSMIAQVIRQYLEDVLSTQSTD